MLKRNFILRVFVFIMILIVTGCSSSNGQGDSKEPTAKKVGNLQFLANGEDFVREGFVSKDGWAITFDHVYINLSEVIAYQADPPYDAHKGGEVIAKERISLTGTRTLDLAGGDEDAPPVLAGEAKEAPIGHYNALSWKMTRAVDGPAKGYSLIMAGQAVKGGSTVSFVLKDETEYKYTGGDYVGEERKGVLQEGGSADIEMTFHFDHIFGDNETPADDNLNTGAPGFQPFADIAKGGKIEADMAALKERLAPADYKMLVDILPTLGHVGEGHCHARVQ